MGKTLLYIAIAYTFALLLISLANIKSLPEIEIKHKDKIFHAVAYCGLVIVWYLQYFMRTSSKNFRFFVLFLICGSATLFGIFIEALQGTTSYRSWDVLDMLANFAGTVVGGVILFLSKNALAKLKKKIQ